MINVGDIFVWRNFPFPYDRRSPIKNRWFVCLGRAPIFEQPLLIYVCTATTKIQEYEKGNSRHGHKHLRVTGHGFRSECVIDVDYNFYPVEERTLKSHAQDVEIKGTLPESDLRQLYDLIRRSSTLSRKVKLDVRDGLRRLGITRLSAP